MRDRTCINTETWYLKYYLNLTRSTHPRGNDGNNRHHTEHSFEKVIWITYLHVDTDKDNNKINLNAQKQNINSGFCVIGILTNQGTS